MKKSLGFLAALLVFAAGVASCGKGDNGLNCGSGQVGVNGSCLSSCTTNGQFGAVGQPGAIVNGGCQPLTSLQVGGAGICPPVTTQWPSGTTVQQINQNTCCFLRPGETQPAPQNCGPACVATNGLQVVGSSCYQVMNGQPVRQIW